MTPLFLQDAIVKELKELFADFLAEKEDGSFVSPSVYKQELPYQEGVGDDDPSRMPYIIVKLLNGETSEYTEPSSVNVALVICAYDDEIKRHGYIDVINMISKIYERFMKNRYLGGYFEFTLPFEWAVQDEELYPYFYGVVQMAFNCPNIIREDSLS